ncbi:MAG: DUF6503 family protein [Marinoscillum sp.]
MQKLILIVVVATVMLACKYEAEEAQKVVDAAIKAHGQDQLTDTRVSFTFRDRTYTVSRTDSTYTYTRMFIDSLELIEDVLINSTEFVRLVNGDTSSLPDSMVTKYSNSVNSVLYFVQLPYLLNDMAVVKSYEGTQTIDNNIYDIIKVQFKPKGGGKDYEDEYRYWFNQKNHLLDYMAYSYETDGGGVRFREAFNRLERNGIMFQDYVNYEVPVGTPLQKIPLLYEADKLKVLSKIINEKISVQRL